MNVWENTVLTDQGRALMAKLTQGHTLDITRAVTGAGFVTPGLLSKQTEVTDPKQTLIFRAVTYPETGVCKLPVTLHNDELADGYKANQIGIFASDPDDGEILFFISQAADAASGTTVPSATEMPGYSAEWTFYLSYGQADGVTVMVDPSSGVSHEEIEAIINEVFKPITNEEIEDIFENADPEGDIGSSDAALSHIDFSNFETTGTWTETLRDGTLITHTNTFDDSGRVISIDNVTITW